MAWCGNRLKKQLMALTKNSIHVNVKGFRHLMSGIIPINNTEIYYEQTGTSKNALLCIPGALGSCRSDFSKQLDHLSDSFSVVAFDPRGYGKSRKNPREFPANFFHIDALDGAQVMKSLGFERYSVLGWSDGGIVGMILAARETSAVDNLIIWGSNSYVSQDDISLIEKTRDLDKWSERMRNPLEECYGADGLKILWNNWMDAFFSFANNHPQGDICMKDLENICCPTLIIHGEKDALVPSFHPEFIHKSIKHSKLVKWPEGKHNLHMRFYQDFNRLVTEFIQSKIHDK